MLAMLVFGQLNAWEICFFEDKWNDLVGASLGQLCYCEDESHPYVNGKNGIIYSFMTFTSSTKIYSNPYLSVNCYLLQPWHTPKQSIHTARHDNNQ